MFEAQQRREPLFRVPNSFDTFALQLTFFVKPIGTRNKIKVKTDFLLSLSSPLFALSLVTSTATFIRKRDTDTMLSIVIEVFNDRKRRGHLIAYHLKSGSPFFRAARMIDRGISFHNIVTKLSKRNKFC